jgi:hypothetical protein
MLQNTYLYEKIMFTNKANQSIICGGKGKDRVSIIKSLVSTGA